MFNLEKELKKIQETAFFKNMGVSCPSDSATIYIKDVNKVFVSPSDMDFRGRYAEVEWLPTSPTQADPFYSFSKNTQELTSLRMAMNKAVMAATKIMDKNQFVARPHDFSVAARNGACFAFRQYAAEQYYDLGDVWERIVEFYYAGHWPVGYFKNGLVII